MNRRKLDVFALNETRWKGKGKLICRNVEGLRSGVNESEHVKEGVAILLSEKMWKCVKESGEVSSRIIWVQQELNWKNWVIVSVYAPWSVEVREHF